MRIYQSLLAAKSLPVANAAELIALAKRKPDQLTYGTAGVGTALHMNAELFARMAGIHLVPVHYRGAAPALNDLIGGSINSMVVSVALGLPAYRAGQIKMLGVGAPKRMPLVSEVPTISESGLPGIGAVRRRPGTLVAGPVETKRIAVTLVCHGLLTLKRRRRIDDGTLACG